MPGRNESPKCPIACHYCRNKKAKCSGTFPCSNCEAHREICSYPITEPRPKKRKAKKALLEERLHRVEALLTRSLNESPPQGDSENIQIDCHFSSVLPIDPSPQSGQDGQHSTSAHPDASAHDDYVGMPYGRSSSGLENRRIRELDRQIAVNRFTTPPSIERRNAGTEPAPLQSIYQRSSMSNTSQVTRVATHESFEILTQKPLAGSDSVFGDGVATFGEEVGSSSPSVLDTCTDPLKDDSEHHGAFSYLSICSRPGVQWVSAQTNDSSFHLITRKFALMVAKNMKLNHGLDSTKIPDPDFETAQKWSTAFFDDTLETLFAPLSRPTFESRLRDHYLVTHVGAEDAAWYALRNVVFAIGNRLLQCEDSTSDSYKTAHVESWRYFQNAMSAHTDLLYTRQDITAIQALLLMSLYTEAIASPALEYGLLSSATRLAQSKGLHMYQGSGPRLSEDKKIVRVWLWWCIYIWDKHLACRGGRPSAICDEDVSCQLPTCPPPGVTVDMNFFVGAIKHAQLSSRINRRLSSAHTSHYTAVEARETVRELTRQLNSWRSSLHPIYQIRPSTKALKQYPNISLTHVMYHHMAYHGSLSTIHSVLSCPWSKRSSQPDRDTEASEQIRKSSHESAKSSREMIMVLQQVEITASAPTWLTFYYPIISFINLFIHILRDATSPSATSDLSLLEVVVGHFSRLEYVSGGEMNITFAREAAKIARSLVTSGKEGNAGGQAEARNFSEQAVAAGSLLDNVNFLPLYDQYIDLDGADFLLDDLPIMVP